MPTEKTKSFEQFIYTAAGPDSITRLVRNADPEADKFKQLTAAGGWGTAQGRYALSFISADYFAGTVTPILIDPHATLVDGGSRSNSLPSNIYLAGAVSGDLIAGFNEHGMKVCGFGHTRYSALPGAPGVITLYFEGVTANLDQRLDAIIDHCGASMMAEERLNTYERLLIAQVKHLFIHNEEFAEHLEGEDTSLSENELRTLGRLITQLSSTGTHFTSQETPEQLEALAKAVYMDAEVLKLAAANVRRL